MARGDQVPKGSLPPARLVEPTLGKYQWFWKTMGTQFMQNAEAYANKRVQKRRDALPGNARRVSRVISGATFIPCHPGRFEVRGPGRGLKFKYFLVHRPGAIDPNLDKRMLAAGKGPNYSERACSLYSTIIEFSNPPIHQGSSQFVIGYRGEIIQMVDLDDVAYHTLNRRNPFTDEMMTNYNSVGVEMEGAVGRPFTEAQNRALAYVLRLMNAIYGIPLEQAYKPDPKAPPGLSAEWVPNEIDGVPVKRQYIVGHSEIDPLRKTDPGPTFNYDYVIGLARALPLPDKSQWYEPVRDAANVASTIKDNLRQAVLAARSVPAQALFAEAASDLAAEERAARMASADRAALFGAAANNAVMQARASNEQTTGKVLSEQNITASATIVPQPAASRPPLFSWEEGRYVG